MKLLLLVMLAVLCFGFQEGTASSCNNYHGTAPAHRCACAKAMMECRTPGSHAQPDAKCKTYCEPTHCHCSGPGCTSRK